MKNYFTLTLIFVVLPSLSFTYYTLSFGEPVDKLFLSISTFLFSIFTGFFISRQGNRFNKVRETVTKFDGQMSNIYRTSSHISEDLQNEVGKVLVTHYKKITTTKKWNYHFEHKSTTLTSIHKLLDTYAVDDNITKLGNQSLGSIIKGLATIQDIRKQMLALSKEKVPREQWALILIFVFMLVGAVSTLPSVGVIFPSILKAAFVVSVISVMYILFRLNNLMFTEKIMGEDSAHDVIEIIKGKK